MPANTVAAQFEYTAVRSIDTYGDDGSRGSPMHIPFHCRNSKRNNVEIV